MWLVIRESEGSNTDWAPVYLCETEEEALGYIQDRLHEEILTEPRDDLDLVFSLWRLDKGANPERLCKYFSN